MVFQITFKTKPMDSALQLRAAGVVVVVSQRLDILVDFVHQTVSRGGAPWLAGGPYYC